MADGDTVVEIPSEGIPPSGSGVEFWRTAYVTIEELAAALRITVTDANRELLQACVDAATTEIDKAIDRVIPWEDSPPDADVLASRVCLTRAVEWFKSTDAAFGVIGFADTGSLQAPRNGFSRHRAALRPIKQQFGVS